MIHTASARWIRSADAGFAETPRGLVMRPRLIHPDAVSPSTNEIIPLLANLTSASPGQASAST